MSRQRLLLLLCCLVAGVAHGAESASRGSTEQAEQSAPVLQDAPKTLSGMSVLGNNEAPKSLVIVPWKTAELGEGIGIADMLDDRLQPVDPDVFARQLRYYQLSRGDLPEATSRD